MNRRCPERIVCLTDEPTEVLYGLGEQDRIVGISGFTVRPARARREEPRLSAYTSAKIDRILALQPDFVVGFSDIQADIAQALIKAGVEVWISNHRSVEGVLGYVRRLGAPVGAICGVRYRVSWFPHASCWWRRCRCFPAEKSMFRLCAPRLADSSEYHRSSRSRGSRRGGESLDAGFKHRALRFHSELGGSGWRFSCHAASHAEIGTRTRAQAAIRSNAAADASQRSLRTIFPQGLASQPASLPLVHLVPSRFGDEPRLAEFRQALAGRISFNVVATPDASQPATILGDMLRMAALAARDIQARQPTGPIILAGFSFGGCVAYETAQALLDAGRDVALLGLFDAPFGSAAAGTTGSVNQWMQPRAIKFAAAFWVFSWDAGRRAALSLVKRLGLAAEIESNRLVFVVFRKLATNRWSPAPLDVDTWLAVSAELAPTTLSIWQRLCAHLRIVQLPGAHVDILQAPAAHLLIPAFEDAVRTAHARK